MEVQRLVKKRTSTVTSVEVPLGQAISNITTTMASFSSWTYFIVTQENGKREIHITEL